MADEAQRHLEKLYKDLERTFRSESVDESDLVENILAVALILYLLGSGYEDEDELTNNDRERLEEVYQLTIGSAAMMVDRHSRGVDMQPTINRVINHLYGVFFYAFAIHGVTDTALYEWVLGPTEHCVDCLEQAGKGAMPGSHWKEMAKQRIYPKSPILYCTGLHCQCEVVEA